MNNSANETERYDRQLRIEGWDQEVLSNSTVCIWGIGALGTFVAAELAMMGVGRLIIIDLDTIEVSNLNRQLLFQPEDVGKYKASVAAKKLKQINPDIEVKAYATSLEGIPMRQYREVDVFVSALDSFDSRRWANSLAIQLNKPLISGGMYGLMGQVQVIIPYKTACFECQPLVPSSKLSQVCTPPGEHRQEKAKLQRFEAPIPGVATMSGLVGSLMAQEVAKLLLHLGTSISYLFIDGLHNGFTELTLARNPNCPLCGENYKLSQVKITIEPDEQFTDIIERIKLTYGLENPKIAWKGKLISDHQTPRTLGLGTGDSLLIIDAKIAKPIKLVAEIATFESASST